MSKKEKIGGDQGICPDCKMNLSSLDYGPPEIKDNKVFYEYQCNFCGLEGKEWFKLKFFKHTTLNDKNLK